MCDFCVTHGSGKKWYLKAKNYSKDLATSDFVRDFCESYFSREITPLPRNETKAGITENEIPTQAERQAVDQRYHKFLHHQVITTEEALSILQIASKQTDEHERTVVLFPCICRYTTRGSDPDLHCFGIAFTDEYTKRFPRYLGGGHRYVSAEEASNKLDEMITKEPLVHAISALGVPYIGLICNCDMQVCGPYNKRLRLGIKSPFYRAHYRCSVDAQSCTGCGTCEDNCPFDVVVVNPLTNLAEIDRENCYGCGVCTRNCPENAISLVEIGSSSEY
ncbi:MAG: ATP-binding protein [Candidatus Hodarchaeales archaeon]